MGVKKSFLDFSTGASLMKRFHRATLFHLKMQCYHRRRIIVTRSERRLNPQESESVLTGDLRLSLQN
jgi:hypothetical protein